MYLNLMRLNDARQNFVEPYNSKCAYPINQEVNKILIVDLENEAWDSIIPSIDSVITLAAQCKVAIVIFFNTLDFMNRSYIRKAMEKNLYNEVEVDIEDWVYSNCLYFGQFNRGLIIDI